MSERQWDVCVVGAGPAGLAAASAAAECGLESVVLDERDKPGGHIYLGLGSPFAETHMDADTRRQGQAILARFDRSGASLLPRRTVWFARPGEVIATHKGRSTRIRCRCLIIANGAMERPLPFPGWTLPGVAGAGGAELMLRSAGIVPAGPVVLAGNGPLLLLAATGLMRAGAEITALVDTGGMLRRLAALPFLPAAVLDLPFLAKGLRMLRTLRASGLPLIRAVISRAEGQEQIERVVLSTRSGTCSLPCNSLLTHAGFVPRTHFSRLLRCDHHWQRWERCWRPRCTAYGESMTMPGVFFAGDGQSVDGSEAAILKGLLAGFRAAFRLGSLSRAEAARRSRPAQVRLAALLAARAYVKALFRPDPAMYAVPDHTLICRCEQITAGDIRSAVREGCRDINEIKTRTRAGMGQCQGRMCSLAMAEVAATEIAVAPGRVGALAVRPPLRPLPLREFCDFAEWSD